MQGYNLTNPSQRTQLYHDEAGLRNWCKFMSQDFAGAFAFGDEPVEFWVDGRLYKNRAAAEAAVASQLAVERRNA